MAKQEDIFKKVVSHAKEYGFIFPSSEIYDGLSAVYDYGQNGAELKNNIKPVSYTHLDVYKRQNIYWKTPINLANLFLPPLEIGKEKNSPKS